MMGLRKYLLVLTVVMLCSSPAFPTLYIWKDDQGRHHLSDEADKLPGKYQALLKGKRKAGEDARGLGYWVDESGNYHFYDERGIDTPPAESAPGSAVSTGTSKRQKRGAEWRGKPDPVVMEARVKAIVSGDTILLEGGQKLKYIGIAFPWQLKDDSPLHEDAKAFQRKMLEGKTVHILFDRKKHDDKGRLLGFVFLGTDTFVNAELVLAGYAKVRTVPPNLEYRELFMRLENFARKNQFGIWKEPKL
jgi:endonuclease YncB( thermonuclease family)